MHLTTEQERVLAGTEGEVKERMLRLLVRLGDIYNADELIPIGSAQVSGVSYKSIGDPGLEFLEDLAQKGARASVLTYINPAGIDMECWESLGFGRDFAEHQMRILSAFKRMGIVINATCTPYLAGNLPRYREHLAWAESSAVSFANSVIGARTNREGGPSALAAAICGVTPKYGLHLDENRVPALVVNVTAVLDDTADFGALGYALGKRVKNKIPYFKGIPHATTDQLKALGAAMAASGAVALYHVEGVTPEAASMETAGLETIDIGHGDIAGAYDALTSGTDPDILIFGCPHASVDEIARIASLVSGKTLKKPLWVCTSRATKAAADRMGYTDTIEHAGGTIVCDTCMVVSPLEELGYTTTAVNSGKAANYLPGFCKQKVVFNTLERLLEGALQ